MKHQMEWLWTETLKNVLSAPNVGTPKGVRDKSMISLAILHGLRVSEISQLDMANIDLEAGDCGTLHVHSRAGQWRTIHLVGESRKTLNHWLTTRALMKPRSVAVFLSLHWARGRGESGQRLSRRGIRQIIDGYLETTGSKKPGVSCDALRRPYTALSSVSKPWASMRADHKLNPALLLTTLLQVDQQ